MNKLLTVVEVSGILNISRNRVYELIKSGLLPAIRIGSYKISESALDEFMNSFTGMDISDPYHVVKDSSIHSA